MPVIRGEKKMHVVPSAQRKEITDLLRNEIDPEKNHRAIDDPPVIFEIPLSGLEKMDVIVVWERWRNIPFDVRSSIIVDAYRDRGEAIADAMGATREETLEQDLLPYSLVPKSPREVADEQRWRTLMLEHGGLKSPDGVLELRFPTLAMAEEARNKLTQELPEVGWSIVQ